MVMRVLYDDQIFNIQRAGGISRYVAQLMTPGEAADWEPVFPAWVARNVHLLESAGYRGFRLGPETRFARKDRTLRRLNRPFLRVALALGRYDLYHQSFYDEALARHRRRDRPLVVTVHDMIPERLPEVFPDPGAIHPGKRALVDIADRVICVSEATRSDLQALWRVPAERLQVCHHGLSAGWFDAPPPGPEGRPYFLFVGGRSHYKDFAVAAEAFARVAPELPDWDLFCAGGGRLAQNEQAKLAALGLAGRVRQGALSEAALRAAYRGAGALIYPSRMEGFGFPILEAWAMGCLPILADQPCFREVAGEGAIFFPPGDADALTEILRGVAKAGARHEEIRMAGTARLHGQFRLEDFHRRMSAIYRDVF